MIDKYLEKEEMETRIMLSKSLFDICQIDVDNCHIILDDGEIRLMSTEKLIDNYIQDESVIDSLKEQDVDFDLLANTIADLTNEENYYEKLL